MTRTLAFGLVAAALAVVFVRLGVWQLARAEEREAANAQIRARLEAPVVELAPATLAGSGAERLAWRRATAEGTYDAAREAVVRGRTHAGSPGIELIAPLRLEGGGEVWVNRGWVPSPDAATVDRSMLAEPGRVEVRGFLRPREGAEPPEIGGLVLQRDSGSGARGYPLPRGDPELGRGPHLSYAIQWFSFATIAVAGCVAYVWSTRRRDSRPSHSTVAAAHGGESHPSHREGT
ncbi:MAG: SURF1 family protein [Gemmatimonadota bacterium]